MDEKKHLVKRHGHTEEYDEKKVYASVYAAALNAHHKDEEAENIAARVMQAVNLHLSDADVIKSSQIKELIVKELGGEAEDVAYLYIHHLDIN